MIPVKLAEGLNTLVAVNRNTGLMLSAFPPILYNVPLLFDPERIIVPFWISVVPMYVFVALSSRVPAPILVRGVELKVPPETTPESVIFRLEAFIDVVDTNATGPPQFASLILVLTKAPLAMIPEPSRLNVSPETV